MALQTSGAISLANVQTEFGGANPISISEYYGVGTGTVPTSGTISLSHFYGQTIPAPAGSQTFIASGTFTVPQGHTQVTICMVGGGGSGANGNVDPSRGGRHQGGGFAGTIVSQTVAVTSGATIAVTIGAGGTAFTHKASGNAGGNTSFGAVVASGGSGGVINTSNFAGAGQSRTTCGGTSTNGGASYYQGYYAYGGEAGFGNGGSGYCCGHAGGGGVGAGGGACGVSVTGYWNGAGGRGEVRVSWS